MAGPDSGLCSPSHARDVVEHRQLARLVVLPQAAEAPQLALEVAGRLAVALQPARLPVDRVDLDQRVDELLAEPRRRSSSRRARRAARSTITSPRDALHHVERRADHRLVVAGGEHRRRAHVGGLERASRRASRSTSCAEGGSGGRGGRRSTSSVVAAADQVGDVGVALADRLGLDRPAAEPVRVEEGLQRAPHEQRREVERGRLLGRVDDRRHGARRSVNGQPRRPNLWAAARSELRAGTSPSRLGRPPLICDDSPLAHPRSCCSLPARRGVRVAHARAMTFEAPRELLDRLHARRDADSRSATSASTACAQLVYWRDYAPAPNVEDSARDFDASNPNAYPGGHVGPPRRAVRRRRRRAASPVQLTLTGPVPKLGDRAQEATT